MDKLTHVNLSSFCITAFYSLVEHCIDFHTLSSLICAFYVLSITVIK